MATRKTKVSASTKRELNELRKERAKARAVIANQRAQAVEASRKAITMRVSNAKQNEGVRAKSALARARQKVQRKAFDAITMGAQSRKINAQIVVNFSSEGDSMTGWNSGDKIFVGIGEALFEEATVMSGYRFLNQDFTDMMFDSIIGVGYHEIGHSDLSPNYNRLLNICAMKFRDEYHEGNWREGLNALDDQRMETATVIWSPNLANSLTSMVRLVIDRLDEVSDEKVNRYNLTYGRFYLPQTLQAQARDDYVDQYGDDTFAVEEAIDAFLVADSYDAMADAVGLFMAATKTCVGDGPKGMIRSGDGDGGSCTDVTQADDAGMTDEQVAQTAAAIAAAMDDMRNRSKPSKASRAAENMADAFQHDMSESTFGEVFVPTNTMPEENREKADALGHAIAARLRLAAAGNAHRWASRTSHGVVDGFTYKTRSSRADMNFHRSPLGSSSLGFDVDVSVLLDVSISMNSHMNDLSVAGHAIKAACDELGTNCTVGIYADKYAVLYPAEEPATGLQLHQMGCTDPMMGFEDLVNHRKNVRHQKPHLVIVLTDGQFDRHIAPYEDLNQHWIGIGLRGGMSDEELVANFTTNGFPEIALINDPLEVAATLENWLHDTVVVAA